jgi:hypothetical protein
MAGNTTRIIQVQTHSNRPLYLRNLCILPCLSTRGHHCLHSTSSRSGIWAPLWAMGKAWNTSTIMRLNPLNPSHNYGKLACNNCAKSACVVNNAVCSRLSQVSQVSFNAWERGNQLMQHPHQLSGHRPTHGTRQRHNRRFHPNYHPEHQFRQVNYRLSLHPSYLRSSNPAYPAGPLQEAINCNPPLNLPRIQA